MPEYTIHFNQSASAGVTVEADSLEEAIDLAYDELPADICAQCSGWGQGTWWMDLSGEWQVDEESLKNDYPEGN